MNSPLRVIRDIVIRSLALMIVSAGTAHLYSAAHPDDDGLGTGLTVMALMVVIAAGWGLVDGFRSAPAELCVTWVAVGLAVSVSTTLAADTSHGSVDWSAVMADLWDGLWFWAALVFLPAIGCGIIQAVLRRPHPPVR